MYKESVNVIKLNYYVASSSRLTKYNYLVIFIKFSSNHIFITWKLIFCNFNNEEQRTYEIFNNKRLLQFVPRNFAVKSLDK